MNNLSMDELSALKIALEFISVKELLVAAIGGFAEDENENSKNCERILYTAVATFLK